MLLPSLSFLGGPEPAGLFLQLQTAITRPGLHCRRISVKGEMGKKVSVSWEAFSKVKEMACIHRERRDFNRRLHV